jgi:hypothetical protein
LIGLIVIGAGFSVSLLLFTLITTEKLTAPIAAIIAPFITGAFTLTGVWLTKKFNIKPIDESVVYYGQEVVLVAPRGEYIALEGEQQILEAVTDNINKAQRFIVADFYNPYGKPKDKPVQYREKIVLKPVAGKRFVSANESEAFSPLCILGSAPDTWEEFILERSENDAGRPDNNIVRFGWTIYLKRHNGQWVWCNYIQNNKRIYGNLDTPPRTMESFHFANPESSHIAQFTNPILYSFIVGVVFGVLLEFLYRYLS